MSDQRLTDLTAATSVGDADLFYIVQGGTSKQVTAEKFKEALGIPEVASALSEYVEVTGNDTIDDDHLGATLVYGGNADIELTLDEDTADGFQCTVLNTSGYTIDFVTEGGDTLLPAGVQLLPAKSGLSAASVYHHDGVWYIAAAEQDLESLIVAVSDETTDLTTGSDKVSFRVPYDFYVTDVKAHVRTPPTGDSIIVDIVSGSTGQAGASILSTPITIDATKGSSRDSTTPPVISTPLLADDDWVIISITQVGSGTPGAGLKVTLLGYQA